VGNKKIKDNQVLWQEVKAYNDILSEMHMLEFGEDSQENNRPSSPSSSFSSLKHNPNPNPNPRGTTNNDNKNSKTKQVNSESKAVAPPVPGLNLKGKKLPASSAGIILTTNYNSNNPKKYNEKDNIKDRTKDVSKNNKGSPTSSSSSSVGDNPYTEKKPKSENNDDQDEFVLSFKDYLSLDRISLVIHRIRAALDEEKVELIKKMRQLENSMESDCEVIVTNRSSNMSEKSTPRSSISGSIRFDGPIDDYSEHDDDKNKFSNRKISYDQPIHDSVSSSASTSSKTSSAKVQCCDVCGTSFSSANPNSNPNSNPNLSSMADSKLSSSDRKGTGGLTIQLKESLCTDCTGRNRRERILGSRLPSTNYNETKQPISKDPEFNISSNISNNISSNISRDNLFSSRSSEKDQPLSANSMVTEIESARDKTPKGSQASSKFRNRLQAARDEHHFIEDDYLS
jgi:hypothetical protein